MKKYRVTLTADERERLSALIATSKGAARKLAHARILLKADQADGGPGWTDERIAEALDVSVATIERVRQRFVEDGLDTALCRQKPEKPSRERTLDGRAEARLLALACSPPPDGRKRWTMQLLADELVQLEVVETVSDETVRRTLQKTRSSRG
jgi:transposase